MKQGTQKLLSLLLLVSAPISQIARIHASDELQQEQSQPEIAQPSWHQLLSQALIDLHEMIKQGYVIPEKLVTLIQTIEHASLEDIIHGLLSSIELLQQDEQLPEQLKEECTRTMQLIAELQSAMDINAEPTRGGILKEFPSVLVGVLRVVNILRVSGTIYINPPAGTTALRVNGDSFFNGNTNFSGNVTITGTTTNEILISNDLSLIPSPAPAPTTNGQVFVSNGSVPAPNAGDLYYVLPIAQGGGIVDLLAGSGTVTQLNSGNGIVLTPNPITTTGTIATNATSTNTASTIISRDASGNFSAGTASLNNIDLPNTTSTVGKITKNNVLFIHNFGTNNTFTGVNSGNLTLTGSRNTGNGISTLISTTSGNDNTAMGANALVSLTSGSNNTAVGSSAAAATDTSNVTAIGASALRLNTALGNTAVGANALELNILATDNTAIGFQALQNNNAIGNTACGRSALRLNVSGTANTALGVQALEANTATQNTAVGYASLVLNTAGSDNAALGAFSLSSVSASQNVALGSKALRNLLAGSSNIAIGYNSGLNCAGSESNNILIGNAGVSLDSGVIRIGTNATHTTCYIQGIRGVTTVGAAIPVLVDTNGQLGTISSSRRYKDNIRSIDASVAEKILALNPVEFNYKSKPATERECGLIAEEVEQLVPELVVHNQDGEVETVRYHMLPVMLLHVIKQQEQRIAALEALMNNK